MRNLVSFIIKILLVSYSSVIAQAIFIFGQRTHWVFGIALAIVIIFVIYKGYKYLMEKLED